MREKKQSLPTLVVSEREWSDPTEAVLRQFGPRARVRTYSEPYFGARLLGYIVCERELDTGLHTERRTAFVVDPGESWEEWEEWLRGKPSRSVKFRQLMSNRVACKVTVISEGSCKSLQSEGTGDTPQEAFHEALLDLRTAVG